MLLEPVHKLTENKTTPTYSPKIKCYTLYDEHQGGNSTFLGEFSLINFKYK